MSTVDVPVCANCGKEGEDVDNICNKCEQVKFCNASCKKKHSHKHKKECEEHIRLAAERATELHDKELFKQPPPADDCPICFVPLPTMTTGWRYQSCCGKVICSGCVYAPVYDNQGNKVKKKCSFCRTPAPFTHKEAIERGKKRVEVNDPLAMYNLGVCYRDGLYGLPQDHTKALEFWHQAAELGYSPTYLNIGYAYNNGKGVDVDKKKGLHYYKLAAMMGSVMARHNLGVIEKRAGNIVRAVKHYMIAVRGGNSESLEAIKEFYTNGHAIKDDYTIALKLYQAYLGEIKSDQRDKAAAFSAEFRYY